MKKIKEYDIIDVIEEIKDNQQEILKKQDEILKTISDIKTDYKKLIEEYSLDEQMLKYFSLTGYLQ